MVGPAGAGHRLDERKQVFMIHRITVACCQISPVVGDKVGNLDRVREAVAEAAGKALERAARARRRALLGRALGASSIT